MLAHYWGVYAGFWALLAEFAGVVGWFPGAWGAFWATHGPKNAFLTAPTRSWVDLGQSIFRPFGVVFDLYPPPSPQKRVCRVEFGLKIGEISDLGVFGQYKTCSPGLWLQKEVLWRPQIVLDNFLERFWCGG